MDHDTPHTRAARYRALARALAAEADMTEERILSEQFQNVALALARVAGTLDP